MGSTEAAECLGVQVPNLGPVIKELPFRRLASGTVWNAGDVKLLQWWRDDQTRVPIAHWEGVPPVAGVKEAALILGVNATYVRKVRDLPEPQELALGPVWLVKDLRALARRRAKPSVAKCGRHGTREMKTRPDGSAYCGICNRERAAARRARNRRTKVAAGVE